MEFPSRQFTLADQWAFAELSGDRNPVHLDMQVARRLLLGGVAVHGIHLVLWALDSLQAAGVALPSLAVGSRAFRQGRGAQRGDCAALANHAEPYDRDGQQQSGPADADEPAGPAPPAIAYGVARVSFRRCTARKKAWRMWPRKAAIFNWCCPPALPCCFRICIGDSRPLRLRTVGGYETGRHDLPWPPFDLFRLVTDVRTGPQAAWEADLYRQPC